MNNNVHLLKQDLDSYAHLVSDIGKGFFQTGILEKINTIHTNIHKHLDNIHKDQPNSTEELQNILSELNQMSAEIQTLARKIHGSLTSSELQIFKNDVNEVNAKIIIASKKIELKVIEFNHSFTLENLIQPKQAIDLTESTIQTFKKNLNNIEQTLETFAAMPISHQYDPRILALIQTIPHPFPINFSSPACIKGAILIFNQQIENLLMTINPRLQINTDTEIALRGLIDNLIKFNEFHAQPNIQSNVTFACRYLANHYRKNEQHTEANLYMLMPSKMNLLPTHPLGDLDKLRTRTEHGQIIWVQVDSTTVRRRQMRICQRKMTLQNNSTLDLSCVLPQAVREELAQHLMHLKTTDQMIINREAIVQYHQKIMGSKNIYDSTIFLEVGSAIELSTPDQRIIVNIGNDPVKWTQYQKVRIKVANNISSQELFVFLSSIGLSTFMMKSRPQDELIERIARLEAAKNPGTAALCTTSPEECAWLSIEKDPNIIDMAREMIPHNIGREKSGEYVESINLEAIQKFTAAGGVGFGVTLGCAPGRRTPEERALGLDYFITLSAKETAFIFANILQDGFLSAMERLERGILNVGRCPTVCIETGSANQVFVRPLSTKQFTSQFEWGKYSIKGSILVFLKSDAVARMPYSYQSDLSGLRNPNIYRTEPRNIPREEYVQPGLKGYMMLNRLTLPELIKQQEINGPLLTAETMFEDILGAQYIMGAIVETDTDKQDVISVLQSQGITQIAGKKLNDAIFVGTKLNTDIQQELMRSSL